MKKLLKTGKAIVAVFMSLLFLVQPVLTVFAEGESGQKAGTTSTTEVVYVSEISVGYIDDLKKSGYTVCKDMINPTSPVTDSEYSDFAFPLYIGYKTTTDKSQAITDVALLGTNDGFEKLDIKSKISSRKSGYKKLITLLRDAITEYQTNLQSGSIYAKTTKKALDYLYVPGENGKSDMSLSSYLTDAGTTDDEIIALIMIGVSNLESILSNQLSFAVTDDMTKSGTKSWLDRICAGGPYVFTDANGNEITDAGKINQLYVNALDGQLSDSAQLIAEAVESFIAEYKAALQRHPDGNIEGILTEAEIEKAGNERDAKVGQASEETITIASGSHIGEVTDNSTEQQKINDAYYIYIYNSLNERSADGKCRYPFGQKSNGSQRSIAEYFLETVNSKPADNESYLEYYRSYYPMLQNVKGERALTKGQAAMFYLSGLGTMYQNLTLSSKDFETITAEIETAGKEITDEFGGPMSVWYGVNKDVFDNQLNVCWTSNAMRQEAAKNRLDEIIKPTSDEAKSKYTKFYKVYDKIDRASQLGGLVASLLGIVLGVAGKSVESFAAAVATIGAAIKGIKTAYSVGAAVCCCLAKVIGLASAVVDLAMLLLWAVAVTIYVDDSSLDDKPYDASVIPDIIFDFIETADGQSFSAEYEAVRYPGEGYSRTYNRTRVDGEMFRFPYELKYNAGDKVDIECRVMNVKSNKYHETRMKNWVVMYYTKDAVAGEPITVAKDANGNDVTFTAVKNEYNPADGYSGLHSFGTYAARNMTTDMGKVAGQDFDYGYEFFLFMHKDLPENALARTQKKYVSDVKIKAYPNNQAEAAIRELKASGFIVIEKNLTMGSSYSTYLGIKTTDKRELAITDLRFAYASGVDIKSGTITFGTSESYKYIGCEGVGMLGLFSSDSAAMGTPILSSGIRVVTSMSDIPADEGYEPVNTFCGGPALDVCMGGAWGADETALPCSYNQDFHAYIYFKPETTYTSKDATGKANQEYLGGLSFFSGWGVEAYAKELGWNVFNNTDLSGHQYHKILEPYYDEKEFLLNLDEFKESQKTPANQKMETLLCYSTTYNPYRAIYDVRTYTAETTSSSLPYNVMYSNAADGVLSGFVACDVFQQGSSLFIQATGELNNVISATSTKPEQILEANARCLRYSHSYRSRNVNEGGCEADKKEDKSAFSPTANDSQHPIGATKTYAGVVEGSSEWYHTEDGTVILRDITPVGLYVTGCTTSNIKNAQPLKVGDLVCQDSATYKDATVTVSATGKKSMSFTPVRDFSDCYGETAANLGYEDLFTEQDKKAINQMILSKLTNTNGGFLQVTYANEYPGQLYYKFNECSTKLYLFIKRSDYNVNNKGKYVASITVSYAGEGYKTKDEDGKEVTKENESPKDLCKINLFAQGAGDLIKINLAGDATGEETTVGTSKLFFNYQFIRKEEFTYQKSDSAEDFITEALKAGNYRYQSEEYGDEFAYLWVTYTAKSKDAISEIHIMESEDKDKEADTITLSNGLRATKCGDSFRYNDGKTYYAFYIVKNQGGMVTDFDISTNVMLEGYKTALSTEGKASSYQAYFLHTKHTKPNKRLIQCISKLATGSGKTSNEAQLELLNAGCQQYLPLHIDHVTGDLVYFGYATSTDTDDAYTGFLIEDAEQNKKLNKIIVGRDTYYKIGQNLNAPAVFDAIMSLYGTKSKRKAIEFDEDDPHYIEDFMFWYDDALADCFDGSDDEEIVEKLEEYLSTLSKEEAAMLRAKVLEEDDDEIVPIRWDIVRNSDDEPMNIAFGSSDVTGATGKVVLDSGKAESYMFVHYSDNFVLSDFDNRSASLFGNKPVVIALVALGTLLLAAAVFLIIKKRRSKKNAEN